MSNESFFDRVKDFVTGHPEQADQGLDKVEEIIDERTGGQYSEQVAQGDDVVREQLGIPDDEAHGADPRHPPAVPVTDAHAGPSPEPRRRRRPTEPGTDVAADGPRVRRPGAPPIRRA